MALARQKPSPSIHERAVRRTQVLDKILAVVIDDSRVTPRYLGLRIVFIQIHIREYSAVGVPPADVDLDAANLKLFANPPAALDCQLCQQTHVRGIGGSIRIQFTRLRRRRKRVCL